MLIVSSDVAVGWNKRTKFYHKIRHNPYFNAAACESGTFITHAGNPDQAEGRKPCKKCFRAKS